MMAFRRSKILSSFLGRNACCSALLVRHKSVSSFQAKDTRVTLSSTKAPKPDLERLLFGHHFSDHMLEIEWSKDQGWSKPLISPLHNLQLHPASKVLHYAVELFEGMKAYRCVDGKVRMFRPRENMKRMLRTAIRTSLPEFDTEELLKCIKHLLRVDKDWVPDSTTSSLYIRPTFIGTEPTLGVSRSNRALLFVLVGPVGPYYPTGLKPVTLLADPAYVRAWPGGCGAYKMGANYAPTIHVQEVAASTKGCQQVLWLYGEDHQLTEVGTMNLFMYWINEQGEKELVTAPLDGLILPGVTRLSLLELARKWGEFKVSERPWNMAEVLKGLKENRVKEIFGAGTACVVSPVERILYMDQPLEIPTMEGQIAQRFLKELTDIHYGRNPSPWMEEIEE